MQNDESSQMTHIVSLLGDLKNDVDGLKETVSRELAQLRSEMATKKELTELRAEMATKTELTELRAEMATKKE
ncbi:MAG: hypothetical protein ABF969_06925, partial [Sporolactobacillus sp.]